MRCLDILNFSHFPLSMHWLMGGRLGVKERIRTW